MKKIVSIVLILLSTVSFSQTLKRDKDLRLTGDINHKIFNDEADNDYPKGLMDNFTLGVQWWEFLGEPMEYYSFKWEATQVIQIDFGTFLKRSDLDKYPNLLKRFDNIRPSHLELGLSASQDLNSSYGNIKYNLEDWQILYTKAGVLSKNLSPGSPETWNEFWKWDWDMQKNYNIETEKFKTLSEEEQKKITRELRTKFRQCTSLNVSVYVKDIKWPKSEINGIYEAYLQYEKGEKKPSPIEEVAEAEKEIANETPYTEDDFWGEVSDIEELEVEIFQEASKFGLKYKNNGSVVLNSEYTSITKTGEYFIVSVGSSTPEERTLPCKNYQGKPFTKKFDHYEGLNPYQIFDKHGRPLNNERYSNVKFYTARYYYYSHRDYADHYDQIPYEKWIEQDDRTPPQSGEFLCVIDEGNAISGGCYYHTNAKAVILNPNGDVVDEIGTFMFQTSSLANLGSWLHR
jgi:hypothetical protein